MKKIKKGNLLLILFAGIILVFTLIYVPLDGKQKQQVRLKTLEQHQQNVIEQQT